MLHRQATLRDTLQPRSSRKSKNAVTWSRRFYSTRVERVLTKSSKTSSRFRSIGSSVSTPRISHRSGARNLISPRSPSTDLNSLRTVTAKRKSTTRFLLKNTFLKSNVAATTLFLSASLKPQTMQQTNGSPKTKRLKSAISVAVAIGITPP